MTKLTELAHIIYLYSVFRPGKYASVQGLGRFTRDDSSDDEEPEEEESDSETDSEENESDSVSEESVKDPKPPRIMDSLIDHVLPLYFHNAIARTLVQNEDQVFAVSSYLAPPEQDRERNVILCIATESPNTLSEDDSKYLEKMWKMLQTISRTDFARGLRTKQVVYRIVPPDILPVWNDIFCDIFERCYARFRSSVLVEYHKAKEFSVTMRRHIPPENAGDGGTETADLKQSDFLDVLLDTIDEVFQVLEANEPGSPVSNRESGRLVFEALVEFEEHWRWVELEALDQWQSVYATEIKPSLKGSCSF